ncbi:MAG: hypothetical protein FJ387_13855 [Verrucomicrobia bacterium]|nr:hypothetical protein [Verrucomicrobiota bacterium]
MRLLSITLAAASVGAAGLSRPTLGDTPPAPSSSPTPLEVKAGDLVLGLSVTTRGVSVAHLGDAASGRTLLATNPPPLFSLSLRHATTRAETRLHADAGWQAVQAQASPTGLELVWESADHPAGPAITVRAVATCDPGQHALRWGLRVENGSPEWSLWRVVFPQLALGDLGAEAAVLFPRGPGEVQRGLWQRSFKYRGNYPGGWCSMQWLAAYRETDPRTGLYLAVHDPWGSTKDLQLDSDPATASVRLLFDHPASDLGKAGNDFTLAGEAVWQLFRGDWFDVATIYKSWVQKQARWWPPLVAEGRADTPAWMRTLHAWALGGGPPTACVPAVLEFQKYLGLPVGFHWYDWHQIPFDNDYPHYFPTKEGFAQGVAELQQSNVFVMPYINGRLWDSRDRGAEDFEFSRRALPAATKKEDGTPYLESYGSKETNGLPVQLAAMCPATTLWQRQVRDLVLRLLQNERTSAVYIDQVAAAAPTLCLDPTHGHPLGGGHWWNEGYWHMLETIRKALPTNTMLTTECNGEPFVRWFDGYLTWHWQHDGQVPVFPAVYGGAIQMFGRAYRGGPTKDLALRMKAGQQLVFGEQLGWLDPGLVHEKENARFFRQLVQLRAKLGRYFASGEMARPPRLAGPLPRVKADWQWSGEWWVTTDAVLTGAWRLPAARRLVLLFVNVSDDPVTARFAFDGSAYGILPGQIHRALYRPESPADQPVPVPTPHAFDRSITCPPRQAEAWELTW